MRIKLSLLALAVSLAKADTITTRDSRTWNGNGTSMQSGKLTLSATFPNGSVQLTFGANSIRAIEFNSSAYNPGAQPGGTLYAAQPKSPKLPGTIYLQRKQAPLACDDIITTANQDYVSCTGQSAAKKGALETKNVQKTDVVRIVVGSQ
jgi:hypothetical protein